MSRPIVCYYRCPRCKAWFERRLDPPTIRIPGLTNYAVSCPQCGKSHISPYEKHSPGTSTYPLPDVEI